MKFFKENGTLFKQVNLIMFTWSYLIRLSNFFNCNQFAQPKFLPSKQKLEFYFKNEGIII